MRMRSILWAAVIVALVAYPFVANSFWLTQIGGRTFGLGTIALSLVFLVAYGGMLSLAQMSIAGIAGYAVAYFTAPVAGAGLLLPWPLALLIALVLAFAAGLLVGLIAVRTQGIYTLMITLAIGIAFYFLTLQNYDIFNGYTGFSNVEAPTVAGIDFDSPVAFYYLGLTVAALCYASIRRLVQTPFGLALQALRDNPRRLRSLGYNVSHVRVVAFGLAGLLAGLGGILNIWLNESISPASVGMNPIIDVLMAAVLGGYLHPIGAYVGAFFFTTVDNFAINFIAPDRFNTLIGIVFLAIVLFSPDGIVGLAKRSARFVQSRWTARQTKAEAAGSARPQGQEDPGL